MACSLDAEILRHAAENRREVSEAESNACDLWLWSRLAVNKGQLAFGLACLTRAAEQEPAHTGILEDLVDALNRMGQDEEALSLSLRLVQLAPRKAEVYARLGSGLARKGHLTAAIAACREAVRLEPGLARLHGELGDVLLLKGHRAEAIASCKLGVSLAPVDLDAHRRLGDAYLADQQWDLALSSLRNAMPPSRAYAPLHLGAGRALLGLGRLNDAADAFREAVTANPKDTASCQHLVAVLELLDRSGEAVSAWCGLGAAFAAARQFADAADAYREAIARKPDCLKALVRLGLAHIELADPRGAIPWFESALAIQPGHRTAHVGLAWASHLVGDEDRGWKEFAWHRPPGDERQFEQPPWDGTPAAGQTILAWADQALGDTIQFVRAALRVGEAGARVIVECHATLAPLISRMPGIARVVPRQTPLPAFARHAPMSALPRLLPRAGSNRIPYLSVEGALKEKWRQRLGVSDDLLVGLVWSGEPTRVNGPFKFAPLSAFAPLADLRHVRYVSLQLGPQKSELVAPPAGLRVEQLLTEPCSILDTAALILNLDLVISVDTMVAHLSGALAKPVWTILPFAPDWRWLISGDISHEYPAMRLFRQERAGDWSSPIEKVRSGLLQFICSVCPLSERHDAQIFATLGRNKCDKN